MAGLAPIPHSRGSQPLLCGGCTQGPSCLCWPSAPPSPVHGCPCETQGPGVRREMAACAGLSRVHRADALLSSCCSPCSWPSESCPGQVNLMPVCTSVVSCSDVVGRDASATRGPFVSPPCSRVLNTHLQSCIENPPKRHLLDGQPHTSLQPPDHSGTASHTSLSRLFM